MEALFPELTPRVLRSRVLKDEYEKWKNGVMHHSPSGLTAHYFAYRAKKEGIDFILIYDSEFSVFRIVRN